MKYLISENRLQGMTQKFLDNYLNGVRIIRPTTKEEYLQFVIDYDLVMDGIIDEELLVNRFLWNHLKDTFSLTDEQVARAIEFWIFNNFGLSFGENIVIDGG